MGKRVLHTSAFSFRLCEREMLLLFTFENVDGTMLMSMSL